MKRSHWGLQGQVLPPPNLCPMHIAFCYDCIQDTFMASFVWRMLPVTSHNAVLIIIKPANNDTESDWNLSLISPLCVSKVQDLNIYYLCSTLITPNILYQREGMDCKRFSILSAVLFIRWFIGFRRKAEKIKKSQHFQEKTWN